MAFKKKSRLRSSVSLTIVLAMVAALVPVVGGAATPATGVVTAGSATKLANAGGSASNGLNGVVSVEITGTMATRAIFKGTSNAAAVAAGKLGELNPPPDASEYTSFRVIYDSVPTTITGLSTNSTVGDVLTAIRSQIPSVTTGFIPTWGYAYIEAKQAGNITIDVKADGGDIIETAIFGGNKPPSSNEPTAAPGRAYDDVSATATFTPNGGRAYRLSGLEFGYVDGAGAFKNEVDPMSRLYTAVKLPAGYDLVLSTGVTFGFNAIGIDRGVAIVTVSSGTRDFTAPAVFRVYEHGDVSDRAVQAGKETTMVVQIQAASSDEDTAAIDGATFTLPAGWSLPTTASVSALAGSSEASAQLSGNTVTVSKFNLKGSDLLTVTLRGVKPATKADEPTRNDDDHVFTGTYKNVGGAAFKAITDPDDETMDNKVHVQPVDEVATIDLKATGNRAGGLSTVYARLYDRYLNEIRYNGHEYKEWNKTVTFSDVTSPSLSPPSSFAAATTDNIWDPNYGYETLVSLSTQQGVTTIRAVVAGEATATVGIDTTGVGAPAKLVLTSEKNPAAADEAVRFHVGLVDANNKATSFLTGDAKRYRLFYEPGGANAEDVFIESRRSETVVTYDAKATTWDMWVVDAYQGALAQSAVLKQVWGEEVPETPEYWDLKVSATPMVPVKTIGSVSEDFHEEPNKGEFGYAAVGSPIALKVQAVDQFDNPIVPKTVRTIQASDKSDDQPGVISSETATLGPDGSYTFVVTSTYPDTDFNQWHFEDAADSDFSANAYTWHYSPKVDSVSNDKGVALSNNADMITLSAKVIDPFLGNPVSGQRVFFTTSVGTLSSSEATTSANGIASVTLKSNRAGDAIVTARSSTGESKETLVRFTDLEAVLVGAPTAQQSARGAWAKGVKIKLRKLDGTFLDVTVPGTEVNLRAWATLNDGGSCFRDVRIVNGEIVFNASLQKSSMSGTSVEQDLYPSMYVAGETAKQDVFGDVEIPGLFGETKYPFAGTLSIGVVNNARATAADSMLPGISGNVRGTGFRPPVYRDDSSPQIHGDAEVHVVPGSGLDPVMLGWVDVDGYGAISDTLDVHTGLALPAGTYDVVIDGVRFPGGLRIDPGFALGTDMVSVSLVPVSGGYAGSVTSLHGEPIQGKVVTLWSASSATGPFKLVGYAVTDTGGGFKFSVPKAPATTYYKATSAADALYAPGESGVAMAKGKAALIITKAPATGTRNVSFRVSGSLPQHDVATTVHIKLYKKVAGKWVYKSMTTASVAAGSRSFTKSVKVTSAGEWRIRLHHEDGDHLSSYSAYKNITIK